MLRGLCFSRVWLFHSVTHTHTHTHTDDSIAVARRREVPFANRETPCACVCVWMMCIWWIRQARTMHYECPTQHFNIFMCMCHPFLLSSTSLLLSNKTSAVSLHFLSFFYILRRGKLSKMYSKCLNLYLHLYCGNLGRCKVLFFDVPKTVRVHCAARCQI